MNKQELDEKIFEIIERIEAHVDMNYDMCDFDKKAYLLDITQACAEHFLERIEKERLDIEGIDLDLITSASKDWQIHYERVGYNKAIDKIRKIFDSTTQFTT